MTPREEDTTGEEAQLVQFTLGAESFGVRVEQVREIVKLGDITRVPKMPDFIEGVMNLRGLITTIIDLRRRFGVEGDARSQQSRIIVAEIGESQIGIIVDSVKDVIRVMADTISPPPEVMSSKVDARFLTGICRLQDGLVMLLDLNTLLSEEEMEGLGRLQTKDIKDKVQDKEQNEVKE